MHLIKLNDNEYERLVQLLWQVSGKPQGLTEYNINCISYNVVQSIVSHSVKVD